MTSRDIMNFTMDPGTSATSSLISNINNLFLNDFLLSMDKTNGLDSETSSKSDSECNEFLDEEKKRKRERKVRYILDEILETEQNYVRDLELVQLLIS